MPTTKHEMTPMPDSGVPNSPFEGFEYRGVRLRHAKKLSGAMSPDDRWVTLGPVLPGNERPFRGQFLRSETKGGLMRAIDALIDQPVGFTPREYAMFLALQMAERMCNEALPKFNWGNSCLDANAIKLLNETPIHIKAVIEMARPAAATAQFNRYCGAEMCLATDDAHEPTCKRHKGSNAA